MNFAVEFSSCTHDGRPRISLLPQWRGRSGGTLTTPTYEVTSISSISRTGPPWSLSALAVIYDNAKQFLRSLW